MATTINNRSNNITDFKEDHSMKTNNMNTRDTLTLNTLLPGGGFYGGEQTDVLPGGGFHGGEQTDVLPGGGFHGGEQTDVLPGGGFHGGEQTDVLPGGGFHGGEQTDVLPGGGFHGDEQMDVLPGGCIHGTCQTEILPDDGMFECEESAPSESLYDSLVKRGYISDTAEPAALREEHSWPKGEFGVDWFFV